MMEQAKKLERAKQLKNILEGFINDFYKVYYQVKFSPKKVKIGKKIIISYELPKLFVIIKKYLSAIESERVFNGFMTLLRKEVKDNDYDDVLHGVNLKKIKNSKDKSYNWVYYSLFKEMINGASAYAPAYQKSLDSGSIAPIKKALVDNDFNGELKEIEDHEKEIKEFKIDIILKPEIHKKFLLDFHESVISWLDAYILAGEFIEDENIKDKEPLTDKWESVEIRFKDYYNIELIINGEKENSDYDKLGFADIRQDSHSKASYVKSWETLIAFSTQEGKIKLGFGDKCKKELFKKDKQDLSKRLKNYFHIKDDPIIYDKENREYQIGLKLFPSPDFRDQWADRYIHELGQRIDTPKQYLTNH